MATRKTDDVVVDDSPYRRKIETRYYNRKREVIQINRAIYARTAVLRAVDHMQLDDYGAHVAEVFDIENGALHAVLVTDVKRQMRIIFKRDPKIGMKEEV